MIYWIDYTPDKADVWRSEIAKSSPNESSERHKVKKRFNFPFSGVTKFVFVFLRNSRHKSKHAL